MLELNRNRVDRGRLITAGKWLLELLPANSYQAQYVAASATIGFAFDGQTGVHAYASDRIRPFRAKPDSLAYIPRGCDVLSESRAGGEYLCLSQGASIPNVGASEDRFNNVIHAEAVSSARFLRMLMLWPDFADPLLLEYHSGKLADCASQHLAAKPNKRNKRSTMTEHRLSIVDELIEEHLSNKLTIGFLAESLGVSEGYFSRAFRSSVGKTPLDYIIDRRVSRARQLIQRSSADLSTIANACGFSSHAHMTETFRRRLGLSPTQLRKAR